MVAPDLTVEFQSISDEARPTRSGTIERNKKYTFYLGRFGPFTERVPLDGFDANAITQRIAALKVHLTQLHS